MKIERKLLLLFTLMSLICAIVGLTGWYGLSQTRAAILVLGEVHLPNMEGLGMIKENANAIKAAERTMINPLISTKDRERQFDILEKKWAGVEEGWKIYGTSPKSKEQQALIDQAKTAMPGWKAGNQQMAAQARKLLGGMDSAAASQAFTQLQAQSLGSGREAFNAFDAVLSKIIDSSRQEAKAEREIAVHTATRSITTAILVMLLGIATSMGLGFISARQITKPLHQAILALEKISLGDTSSAGTLSMGQAVDCSKHKNCGRKECPSFGREDHCWVTSGSMAVVKNCPRAAKGEDCRSCALFGAKTEVEELASIINGMANSQNARVKLAMGIANGDLTHEVKVASDKDGLGKALLHMQQSLLATIGQIKLASNEIAEGSLQIADSSQSLAQGATQQSSALEEISAAMTQISSMTKMTAEHANQAQEHSTSASTAAAEGNRQMEHMVAAMEEIRIASQGVANVIKVIEEIAFQTNMLALNAAVEAAHAGQHGKGFAVVAEEVRNLAARSAKAAKETAELIVSSVAKTENGAKIADQTAGALGGIVARITKTSELVAGIAGAAHEQSQGIDQVSQGLHQIDQVTLLNTDTAEKSAAASQELSGQAAQMNQLMLNFKIADNEQTTMRQIGM